MHWFSGLTTTMLNPTHTELSGRRNTTIHSSSWQHRCLCLLSVILQDSQGCIFTIKCWQNEWGCFSYQKNHPLLPVLCKWCCSCHWIKKVWLCLRRLGRKNDRWKHTHTCSLHITWCACRWNLTPLSPVQEVPSDTAGRMALQVMAIT